MKPSKILKEYIEKRVKEAYGKESQEEIDFRQARADFEVEIKKANERIKDFISQVENEIVNPHNFYISRSSSCPFSTWSYGGERTPIEKASKEAEGKRIRLINETIEDILIELELGGTKAQLEERLAKLGKENEVEGE